MAPPDEKPPDEQPPLLNPLPYKTWVLKVSIHCQACKRKVKKVLQTIEGVYIIEIDEKQHKVTVTGNVEADALIKKLIRSGKNAKMWQDNPPYSFKDKKSGNFRNSDQKPEGNENTDEDDGEDEDEEKQAEKVPEKSVRFEVMPPGNPPAGAGVAPTGPKKKKKKKKKKSSSAGNAAAAAPPSNNAPANTGPEASRMGGPTPTHVVDQGNLGHPYPPLHQFPPSYAPQQAYVVSYNVSHPSVSGAPAQYYMPSSPYTYPYTQAEVHSMRCRPLDSFEILSDENPNACYIM